LGDLSGGLSSVDIMLQGNHQATAEIPSDDEFQKMLLNPSFTQHPEEGPIDLDDGLNEMMKDIEGFDMPPKS